jgi:hypothetical protein
MADIADSIASEQADYKPLIDALRVASGFCLLLVECNAPLLRKHLLNALERDAGRPLVRVDVREALSSDLRAEPLDALVADAVAQAPPDAVISFAGLEAGLPSDDMDRALRTLQELNFRRGIYQRLGRPLLLWLPTYAMKLFARHAADFHDWYSGTFVFSTTKTIPLSSSYATFATKEASIFWKGEEEKKFILTLIDTVSLPKNENEKQLLSVLLLLLSLIEMKSGNNEASLSQIDKAIHILESLGDIHNLPRAKAQRIESLLISGRNKEALAIAESYFAPYFAQNPLEQNRALQDKTLFNALLLSKTHQHP